MDPTAEIAEEIFDLASLLGVVLAETALDWHVPGRAGDQGEGRDVASCIRRHLI
jgi:hypothetical protein